MSTADSLPRHAVAHGIGWRGGAARNHLPSPYPGSYADLTRATNALDSRASRDGTRRELVLWLAKAAEGRPRALQIACHAMRSPMASVGVGAQHATTCPHRTMGLTMGLRERAMPLMHMRAVMVRDESWYCGLQGRLRAAHEHCRWLVSPCGGAWHRLAVGRSTQPPALTVPWG